jgi:hypothetical protein
MGIRCFITRRSVAWTMCRLDTIVCPNFGSRTDLLDVVKRLWKE